MKEARALALRIARDIWHNGPPRVSVLFWDDLPYTVGLWYQVQSYEDKGTGRMYRASWVARYSEVPAEALPFLERVWETLPTLEREKPPLDADQRAEIERLAALVRVLRGPSRKDLEAPQWSGFVGLRWWWKQELSRAKGELS